MYNPFAELYRAIQDDLNEKAEHWKPPKHLNFRASEAASCVHQIWHRLMGHKPAPGTAAGEFIRKRGQADHENIQRLFIKYNIPMEGIELDEDGNLRETESKVVDVVCPMPGGEVENFTVSGRADGIFETGEGLAIFEYKSMNGNMFYWLQKAYKEGNVMGRLSAYHQSYLWQMQVSMYIFGTDLAWLGPGNRSNALPGLWEGDEPTGVYVRKDPELISQILKRFGATWRCVREGKPPPDNMKSLDGSYDCKYCDFYHLCHGAKK